MVSKYLPNAFERAWEKFSESLTDPEKALFLRADSPSVLVDEIKSEHDAHIDHSLTYSAVAKLKPAVNGLLRFGKAFDVLCNAYPEVLSLLWGGLRVVLHIAKSYAEFFENIVQCVSVIGTSLSRMKTFEQLFPHSVPLKTSLEELYAQILDFCYDAKRLFVDIESKRKRHLIPKRLRVLTQALWSSFSAQFDQTKEDIEKIVHRIDKEAFVASLEAAKTSQEQQEAQWLSQNLENDEAKQHRLSEQAEVKAQRMERDEQSKWREAEAILWQSQQQVASVLTDFIADETLLQTTQWLSPVDADVNHEVACKSHHPGTCTWILHSPQFKQWLAEKNSLIWVHAIPGAGKTVLAASVIECIRSTLVDTEALVYYYFDYKNRDQQCFHALLASLVASLVLRYPSYFSAVEVKLRKARSSGRSPTATILRNLLLDAFAHFSTLYVVVDALDECEDRDALFEQFFDLPSLSKGNVKLFSTSRKTADIQEGFGSISHLAVDMKESLVQPDIRLFIRAEVAEIIRKQKIKLRNAKLKDEIIDILSEKADGMFQWVRCQLDQLRKLKTDKAIRMSLTKLPKGLDETYLRMLQQLVAQNVEDEVIHIQRLLRWLTHSARPLSIEELAEAIAIDLDQEAFDESAVLTDPMDLLRYGESLVVVKASRVHLSHFSVREFLVSDTVRKEAPSFYMGTLESHAELAGTCLTYLHFSNFAASVQDVTASGSPQHLLHYACSEWPTHYEKVENFEMRPKNMVSSLLSMSPILNNFLHLCMLSSTYKVDLSGCTPIHYCAIYGLLEQLKHLLDEGQDINLDAGPYGSPLNCAVKYDQIHVVRHLVDRGANPECAKMFDSRDYSSNALHWALDEDHVNKVSIELVEVILDSAVGIDANTIGGLWHSQRPMHYAARGNRLDIMKVLIRYGAELDAPDLDGKTPLAIAVEEGNITMASFLLDQGATFVGNDVNHCDSIRESPLSIDALVPTMSGAYWDVVTTLRSQSDGALTSTHWGFALGAAARDGKLDPLRQLLDLNINTQAFACATEDGANNQAPVDEAKAISKLSIRELEARIGTMFSALAPAHSGGNLDIILALLDRMTDVLAFLQLRATEDLRYEVHQVLIHDREDSRFCKASWDKSITYLAILVGYLQTAKLAIDEETLNGSHAVTRNPLGILKAGWPKQPHPEKSEPIAPNTHTSQSAAPDHSLSSTGGFNAKSTTESGEPRSFASSKLKTLCERARIFWHGKRNTRNALHFYLLGVQPPVGKVQVIEFLLRNGCDANALDCAGRTPLYWATTFARDEVSGQDVCEILARFGGKLHAPNEIAVVRLRSSILKELAEMVADTGSLDINAIDLSRKSDWNILGRYFYFAKDFENASIAFETATVYSPDITARVPVFHYFFCDECNPGDYRDETLIKGYRYVVRDSLDSDLCEGCQGSVHAEAFPVPSQRWIEEQRKAHTEMLQAFEAIDAEFEDYAAAEKAKNDYKRQALIAKRAQMLQWVKDVKEEWETGDIAWLAARYSGDDWKGKDSQASSRNEESTGFGPLNLKDAQTPQFPSYGS